MSKEQESENKTNKAWFEKDIEDWDENDEQEAYMNLFLESPQNKN